MFYNMRNTYVLTILSFQIWIVARMDPLKYLFEKPILSGRLLRWLILLAEFDLKHVARKTIKGSIMSDFCAKNPWKEKMVKKIFQMRSFWTLS